LTSRLLSRGTRPASMSAISARMRIMASQKLVGWMGRGGCSWGGAEQAGGECVWRGECKSWPRRSGLWSVCGAGVVWGGSGTRECGGGWARQHQRAYKER
jgi:hypothetical protein